MRSAIRFWADRSGNYAVMFAILSVPVMVGVAGIADLAGIYNRKANAQAALDAAAFAIARRTGEGLGHDALEDFGQMVFESNLADRRNTNAAFRLVSAPDNPVVEVRSKLEFSGYFAMSRDWNTELVSVVESSPGADGPACVLALDDDASKAIWIQGSTDVRMDGCILVANSDAGDAIARQGAARIAAECAHTSGGTEGLSGLHASFDCPAPVHNRPPVPDPFAGLAPPAYSVCKSMPSGGNGKKSVTELTPGTYCYQRFSGNFDLAPGEYILRGGEIKLGGNGGISGNGVTLFLLEDASITFGANETINLTAPTEGDYAGIVIFQAPGNTADLKMNGTADSRITGFIYAPDAHVDLTGNVSVSDEGHCTRIVAGTIRFIGNSSIRTDCEEELADREIEIEDYVRLTR